jgi:hypothetical protein
MDARLEKHFHVYESHGNSFEDSAPITLVFGMIRHSLQRVEIRPQHGFWGAQPGSGATGAQTRKLVV